MIDKSTPQNNLLAIIAVVLITLSGTSHLLIFMFTEEITGKTVGNVDLCIGYGPPATSIIEPILNQILNGTVDVSAYANHTIMGPGYIDYVVFEYRQQAASSYTQLFNDSNDNDTRYNFSWNTVGYPEGECDIHLRSTAVMNISNCNENTGTGWVQVSINNLDEPPVWSEFYNNITTNFTAMNDPGRLNEFFNVAGVVIGQPDLGVINYSAFSITVEDVNLNSLISIGNMSINISDSLPCVDGSAARLSMYNVPYLNPSIYRNSLPCNSTYCYNTNFDANTYSFNIANHQGIYYLVENLSTSLTHYDSTDPQGGSQTKYVHENVTFVADWIYTSGPLSGQGINTSGTYCQISFNYTANASNFTTPVNMSYTNSSLYEYTTTFPIQGNHSYFVECLGSSAGLDDLSGFGEFIITNRPPIFPRIFNTSFPNLSWNEDTTLTGIDLDDYFSDPDGDILNYTFIPNPVLNINVSINSISHILTLIPANNWYGNRTVQFIATDPFGLSNISNIVNLEVIDVPEPTPPPPSGGSGGGGSSNPPPPSVICIENWWCEDWGPCLPTNISKRMCYDATKCGTTENRPNLTRECVYIPTCFDNLRNQGEVGVDCGGPCPACPNCTDKIRNQGETGIDCGGPCPACPTCNDGIQNQGETGIDCGGPCPACPTCNDGIKNQNETGVDCGGPCPACESPAPLPTCEDGIQNQGETGIDCGGPCPACEKKSYLWLLISLLLILLMVLIYIFRHRINDLFEDLKKRILMLWHKLHEKKPSKPSLYTIEVQTLLKLKELKEGIGSFHMEDLFGEYRQISNWFASKAYNMNYEFTLQELYQVMREEKVPDRIMMLTISMYQKMEEISYRGHLPEIKEFQKMLKQAAIIVEETVLFKVSQIHPVQFIKTMLADMNYCIYKKKTKNAEKLYFKVVEVYDQQKDQDKKQVYHKMKKLHKKLVALIKEESLGVAHPPKKKPPKKKIDSDRFKEMKKNIRISASVLLVLISALMLSYVLQIDSPTGFVFSSSIETKPEILPVPLQTAAVGETFNLKIYTAVRDDSRVTYSDSTDLFDISKDGTIKFTPSKSQIGEYNVVIKAESSTNDSYILMRLNVEER